MEQSNPAGLSPRRRLVLLALAGVGSVCLAVAVAHVWRTLPLGFIGPLWFSVGLVVMVVLATWYAVAVARSRKQLSRGASVAIGLCGLASVVQTSTVVRWERFLTWHALTLMVPVAVATALAVYVSVKLLESRRAR